jgi:uncharacterized membrane protein
MHNDTISSQMRWGGVLLGVGLGGFFDGILLHQILQWHNMLSSVLPPTTLEAMHTNMLWDGLFHAATWIATLAGVLLIWSGVRRSSALPPPRWLLGLMLIGWGAFNFVEGAINHHLLEIHHVRQWGPNPVWDYGFLASGPLLIAIGWMLTRSGSAAADIVPTGISGRANL